MRVLLLTLILDLIMTNAVKCSTSTKCFMPFSNTCIMQPNQVLPLHYSLRQLLCLRVLLALCRHLCLGVE